MKQETYNQIVECKTIDEVEVILDTLKDGEDYKFVEEKIDDGCSEDDEDDYVMMRSYDFYLEGDPEGYHVRFYYGNETGEIGYID